MLFQGLFSNYYFLGLALIGLLIFRLIHIFHVNIAINRLGLMGDCGHMNRIHKELARSLKFHVDVPDTFWGDCVLTACYLINRSPSSIFNGKFPIEIMTKRKSNIDHLRTFGC